MPIEEDELSVEPIEQLGAYKPTKSQIPTLFFIDGVRRTEASIALQLPNSPKVYRGIFASLCAGTLMVRYGGINLIQESLVYHHLKRYLFTDLEQNLLESFPKLKDTDFEPKFSDQDMSLAIMNELRSNLEINSAIKAIQESSKYQNSIVICDGTLDPSLSQTHCVGLIKNSQRAFVEPELLSKLGPSERSHIFAFLKDGKPYKYSWYVKLNDGSLENLIRLEIFACDSKTLYNIVNTCTYALPLLSSNPFQDQRSPQNLLPISSLERFLRHHLGSYKIIRSNIIKALRD